MSENVALDLILRGRRTFAPTDIAGLHSWFDFSDASKLFTDAARTTPVAADADPIGGVADGSGNGRHLAQATAGKRPLYKTAIVNGKSISRYDFADDLLAVTFGAALAQPMTAIIVMKLGINGTVFPWDAVDNTNRIGTYYDGNLHIFGPTDVSIAAYTTGVWNILTYVVNGASSTVYKDGAVYGSATVNPGANSLGGLTIGARYDGNATVTPSTINGDIAEFLLYSSALGSANRSSLHTHLGSKYGIAVA